MNAPAEGRLLGVEQAAPRAGQRDGARYDSANAPADDLLLARRGTAYFRRGLDELSDADLDGPSLLPGWSRRHVVAHVGYNAWALAHLTTWARTGVEEPMYGSPTERDEQIALGATLPARALRNLVDHSVTRLNVEWRDLTDEQWDAPVRTFHGRKITARETAYMRAKEVWIHAVDLDNLGSFRDFPPALLDRLIADVIAAWARRGESVDLTLLPTDRPGAPDRGAIVVGSGAVTVTGASADLARWLTGRGARRLGSPGTGLPDIPVWF